MPDTLALLAGMVAAVAVVAVPSVLRTIDDRALVGAVVCALMLGGTGYAPLGVVRAVALLVVGWRTTLVLRVGIVVLAAVMFGAAMPTGADTWLGLLVAVSVLAALRLVHKARVPFGPAPALALLAWVPVAAYGAVPDTEQITVVAVAMAATAAVVLVTRETPGAAGTAGFVGLVVWAIGAGAAGREAAAIGALGCFGVLFAGPVAGLARRTVRWSSARGALLVGLHLACGVGAARYAGLEQTAGSALWRVIVVVVPTVAVSVAVILTAPRARPDAVLPD